MNKKVIISADRTCDLSIELLERFDIKTCPYHIVLNGKEYLDNVDITSEMIFNEYYNSGTLPQTACINTAEYINFFKDIAKENCEIVHLNLSSALSLSYQNCVSAAKELGGIYPIDSKNLSTGTGLLVLAAAKMADEGLGGAQIAEKIEELKTKVDASFILDTLEFMKAGGRCSAITAFSANILKIKPCIEVDPISGEMKPGKKFRGNLERVLTQYTKERLSGKKIRNDFVFITYSSSDHKSVEKVKKIIGELTDVHEIHNTSASCTISCHCGPNCLGVLFIRE